MREYRGGARVGVGAAGDADHSRSKVRGHHHHHHQRREESARRRSTCGLGKRDTARVGSAILFFFAALMVLVDIMKNRRIRDELQWHKYYMRAVVDNEHYWHMGWRLEDLARQASSQKARMLVLLETLQGLRSQRLGHGGGAFSLRWARGGGGEGDGPNETEGTPEKTTEHTLPVLLSRVLAEEEDLNRIVTVECAARPEVYVQVGKHAMVASVEDSCKVFSSTTALDPHALFEKIDLGEGRFALRAFSNKRFLRVVPPSPLANLGEWNVWALEVGAPEMGLPEVFQMRDGMVYSEVMRGYLSCSGDGQEAEVKAFVGEYLWKEDITYRFIFNEVSEEAIARARTLRQISRTINVEQGREADEFIAKQATMDQSGSAAEEHRRIETIAICVPMTSRGTLMTDTEGSPVWSHAFSTFLASTNWRDPKFRFHWYFGFDVGDPIYDAPDAAKKLKQQFLKAAGKEFGEQGLSNKEVISLVNSDALVLKTKAYNMMQHAPSHVVSALMQEAYDDGCDYFYQINDDTFINTPGWAEIFTELLRKNPLGRNVGVTGPTDTNNRRILTHAFVHRTHMDIFGRFFPVSFRNWWSDDWISNVYGRQHTLRDHPVTITHDVKSQKTGDGNRYLIDHNAQYDLHKELRIGHVKLSKWLKANRLPSPLLPVVCGYSPIVSNILKVLEEGWGGEKALPKSP